MKTSLIIGAATIGSAAAVAMVVFLRRQQMPDEYEYPNFDRSVQAPRSRAQLRKSTP